MSKTSSAIIFGGHPLFILFKSSPAKTLPQEATLPRQVETTLQLEYRVPDVFVVFFFFLFFFLAGAFVIRRRAKLPGTGQGLWGTEPALV